ncbi:protein Jade-3 isoform X2 [Perca flavescens]|uniref:protein Jade-3 isoform X2 n=1 Tax=Perca flavescens TaxID=8167 RepID=UPI00106F0A04|nr:protein Jade-3 isoform X2 [Perca flavescens]
MKRLRSSSSSDSSDNESPSTSFCSSNKYGGKPETPASNPKKPAEVFRKDLISAMKLPDSHHVSPEDYYLLADTWKQEWEKGVQVPASPDTIPEPSVRVIVEKPKEVLYTHPRKYIQCSGQESTEPGYVNIKELAEAMCRYDLDDMDLYWLHALNRELDRMGEEPIDELTMERTMEALESQCYDNMNHAIETVEGLGIEYDEDVICDVCRSPDSEEGNDMVFCDKCNICVHQACYGIVKVPVGNWLCRTCVLGIDPQCLLCPQKGGAMKATRAGTKWAHVSCALWIPEVSIACPERMEPITKVSHIPPSRWSLICSLCKWKTGACIQVRNLCYMVSRREKLKVLQSKAQEQMFNLHVKLLNQEISAGLPTSSPVESMLFRPPPRITLKLKMPKSSSLGNSSSKSGNGPLCPDNSGNVSELVGEGLGQGKPQLHGRGRREERSNGRLSASSHSRSPALPVKPTGKPLALHAALHGHSSNSNGKLDQDRACVAKSNGLLEKFVAQKDRSCQTPSDQDASNQALDKNSFRKSAMEHFGRSFKEATINLVRTTEGLRASDKLSRKGSAKERLWAKPVTEHKVKSARSYQDSDGYCPDLELSDSEPEAKGRHRQPAGLPQPGAPRKGVSRGKQSLGSRHPIKR